MTGYDSVYYDQLEDHLDNLPPGPRHAFQLPSDRDINRQVRRISRQRDKWRRRNRSGVPFSTNIYLQVERPLELVHGWATSLGMTDEELADITARFASFFTERNLFVELQMTASESGWKTTCRGTKSYEAFDFTVKVTDNQSRS